MFVAGAKVRTDLFTIPFSKGLNLICIHSKKYIEDDPATKPLKIQENLAAMKVGWGGVGGNDGSGLVSLTETPGNESGAGHFRCKSMDVTH